MKIIQITDTHLVADGGRIYGIDPRARLAACVADVNRHHADADFCVLSGDLTDDGAPGAYRALREVLSALRLPFYLMAGNHDQRDNLRAVFPEAAGDAKGFLQRAIETPAGHVLLLDTVDPGRHSGAYCRDRAQWLARRLAAARGAPVYLFLHHPPFAVGLPAMDKMRLLEPRHLIAALEGHDDIRHLFFGHVHRPVAGSWRGIPVSALRATAHNVALDFETVAPVPKTREPPAYAVILIGPEQCIVHSHDFLDDTRIADARSPAPPAPPTRRSP